jgi:ubiquinone/menaquinone biosynthesis C-methylase UbiE
MQNKLSKKELKEIVQWDVKNWSKVLPFWELNSKFKSDSKVLALGEREGGLSLYFAKKGYQVICSDYNPLPDTTKDMHEQYGLSQLISYKQIDMRQIDLPDASQDIVVFKSVIGALGNKEDQKIALNEIYRVLKKGGVFLFAENLEGSFIHQYLRKKFVNWGERWCYVNDSEMKEWTQVFSDYKTKSVGVTALFGRSESQRNLLSKFDNILTPITPKKWRYILFGALTK